MTSPKCTFASLSLIFMGLTLAGCGVGVVNDPAAATTTATPPVTGAAAGASGVDMGGHAPLVGAHIYLVQLGDTAANVTASGSGRSPQPGWFS